MKKKESIVVINNRERRIIAFLFDEIKNQAKQLEQYLIEESLSVEDFFSQANCQEVLQENFPKLAEDVGKLWLNQVWLFARASAQELKMNCPHSRVWQIEEKMRGDRKIIMSSDKRAKRER